MSSRQRYIVMVAGISVLFSVTSFAFFTWGVKSGTITWLTKTNVPVSRVYSSFGIAENQYGVRCLYMIAGYDQTTASRTRTTWEYNPLTDTWTLRAPMPPPARFVATRDGLAERDGIPRIYVVGGSDFYGWSTIYLADCDEYTPSTNTWLERADMPTAREGPGSAFVGGLLYVIGGGDAGGEMKANEAYDPETDSWTTRTPMPTARISPATAVGVNSTDDTLIYIIGGARSSDNTVMGTVEAYNPATNSWISKAPMTPRSGALAVTYQDTLIYVMGGTIFIDLWAPRDTILVEVYNTRQNTWTPTTPLPLPRCGKIGGVFPDFPPEPFNLALPDSGATISTLRPTLHWRTTFAPRIWATGGSSNNVATYGNIAAHLSIAPISYTLWYDTLQDFSTTDSVTNLPDTFYTFPSDLVDLKTYYWKVRASGGAETWSINTGWWFYTDNSPMAVEMGWFRATGEYEEVLLEWETYHEFDNLEWKIVRATEREGEYMVRKTLPAEGRPNIYEWTDSDVKPGTTYFYKLGDVDRSGNVTWHGPEMATAKLAELIPFGISQNYPNPVSNSTTIEYYVPGKVGKQSFYVTLQIFDITGSLVRTLVSEEKISGRHQIEWHREDERGRRVGAGIYLYRLSVGDDVETRKIVVVR